MLEMFSLSDLYEIALIVFNQLNMIHHCGLSLSTEQKLKDVSVSAQRSVCQRSSREYVCHPSPKIPYLWLGCPTGIWMSYKIPVTTDKQLQNRNGDS
jgi:hypothetical protein